MTYRDDGEYGRGVSRYLGFTARETGDPDAGPVTVEGHAEVRDHIRGPGGGVRAGAMLTLVDSIGGWCGGLAALPDGWVVSTSLTLRTLRVPATGPVRLDARVLRRGRSSVVTDVIVVDEGAGAVPLAEATLTSAILVPAGGPPRWPRPARLVPPSYGDEIPPPMLEGFGVTGVEGTSEVELEVVDELRNPWGIVHGGVTAVLVDAASERTARAGLDGPTTTTDVVLHYLAPGRAGPLRTRSRRLGTRADGHLVRVEVRDVGADDRLLALAVTTVRPL